MYCTNKDLYLYIQIYNTVLLLLDFAFTWSNSVIHRTLYIMEYSNQV